MRSCLALIILLLFVVGCNSEYAQLSAINKTRIKITATLPSGITADKIMLWGKNANGNQFARVIEAGDEETFIFDNGAMTLYAIAWTAPNLTGDVYCGTQPNTLSGPDINLNLALTNADCDRPYFKGTTTLTTPVTLGDAKVEWCEAVTNITGVADKCTDELANASRKEARGHAMSYRYVLKTFDKSKNKYSFRSDEISSVCLTGTPNAGTPSDGLAISIGSQIPIGDGSTTPFYLTLETFPGDWSCGDSTHGKISTVFQNGLIKNSTTTKYFQDVNFHKIFVRMSGAEVCNAKTNAQTFAGGNGMTLSPYLICNPTQFYNMHTTRTSSFKLMSDIDLAPYYYGLTTLPNIPNGLTCLKKGSNFIPLGYDFGTCSYSAEGFFSGDFDGGGKTIKGMKINMPDSQLIGLYTRKFGGEIRRVKFENASVKGQSSVGVIAGGTQVMMRDIHLDKVNVESTLSNAGGLAGSSTAHPNNCAFKNILMTNSTVTGYLGSIGGIISSSDSCEFNYISVSGIVKSTVSGTVGGIAGSISNSIVNETSFEGVVSGFAMVGGITGNHYNSQVLHNKVIGNVQVTSTGSDGRAGGLIGYTNGVPSVASSYVLENYFFGQITQNCLAVTPTDCGIGNIVGDPGGWGAGDFSTNLYTLSNSTSGKSPIVSGTNITASAFYNLATVFPAAFIKTGDIPRLSHEMYAGITDMRHPCQKTPSAYLSVADQIAAGRGTSESNPISVCNFYQFKDMRTSALNASKFYKFLSPILVTEGIPYIATEFTGQIDGNGQSLIRMQLTGAIAAYPIAWWNSIGATGVIKNLTIVDTRLTDVGPASSTAVIATTNNGTIDSVYAVGTSTVPMSGGEHSLFVHTNNGTIKNSYVGGYGTITNQMAGVAFNNTGFIQDSIFNSAFSCTWGVDCHRVAGISINNSGTIRRNEVTSTIEDSSAPVGASDFMFVSVFNTGTIEDIQIQPTSRIVSKGYAAHGIVRENSSTGIIQRVYNEGSVAVFNGSLPAVAPFGTLGDSDFIEGASGGVGYSYPGGSVSNIAYTKIGRWSYPSQYGYVSRTPMVGSCQYILSGDLPASWETAMTTASLYGRFGLMVSQNEAPFFFVSTPSLFPAANDTFLVDDAIPCSMSPGNPTAYFWPYDYRSGADLIQSYQRFVWATFSGWSGAYNITVDDTVYHQYKYNEANGITGTKPIWIFDTTNSMRLAR